jgi:phytoene/squalene synthetase
VLPQEALSELGWTSGDILDLKVEANCLRAVRSMTKHKFAMAMARRAFARYRETFEALAKS